MKYLIIPFLLFLIVGCSFDSKEIKSLDFPYKKNYQANYLTRSTLFREDSTVRITKSDTLFLKISRDLSEKGSKTHEWLMLPGMNDKAIPDTMISHIDATGLYNYYSPDLLPEGAKEIKLIALPIKPGMTWKSAYLSFPAKATYLTKDSIVVTPAGEFNTFAIQYEFSPFYMNELLQDQTKDEVRGVIVDYYSKEVGKVLTQLDFYVTDRKSGKRKWKILSNQSVLYKLTIPK